ncbi:macrophage mannose receptor 1-like isoform X2 [Triplophysa dalaica]|uniref:macrophage mannose receptor 1-like isoform X2 n=1 Tax=Triplophysa dalaica TaxID=1582913 RepID=UPI0024E01468|nr:macrophage mannose receptor 1-like isoform X2 [Triplophysa dalaica]
MEGTEAGKGFAKRRQSCKLSAGPVRSDELAVMLKHQRGAVRAVMDMSLFVLLLLSGLICSATGLWRPYHYINQNMTWAAAQSYCRERFTDLATVDSIDDVNRMINAVNDGYGGSVWIGMKRVTQGRWGWSNGENRVSQYSNWQIGEPNGDNTDEYCGFSYCGLWHDMPCSDTIHFTCYNESTGYISIQLWKNWTDAQSYCRQYHTDLATWSDQWSLFFRNWAAGFTSQTSVLGNCVTMSTISGKWIQIPCTEQHPFICYGDLKKQIIRLNLSHDGKYNLNDPSKQTAILNKITEKLKNAGLDSHCTLSWRKDEGGEVFHPESKHTLKSNIRCDSN